MSQLETWAVVGLMGHGNIAGFVRDVPLGTGTVLRVEVPKVDYEEPDYDAEWKVNVSPPLKRVTIPAFVRFIALGAVYDIGPCSEETATLAASQIRALPPAREWDQSKPVDVPF